MCGIVAMFGEIERSCLAGVNERLRHRGPDGSGVVIEGRGGLGHTRLSLLDLERGAQPLWSRRGRRVLAYNGEIYNHFNLRRELEGRGVEFSSRCDTEVVLAAFEEWGADCIERFDGMYTFALLESERLVIVRDPFGIKPLFRFTARDGRYVAFASEASALLAHGEVSSALDPTAILEASVLGYPLGERTFFAEIQRVPAGAVLEIRWNDGRIEESMLRRSRPVPRSPSEAVASISIEVVKRCEEALDEQVRLQCIADHPVGVMLSGGLDSSVITALAARHTKELFTFTLATDPDDEELAVAGSVARALGSVHAARLVGLDECLRRLPFTIASLAWPTSFSLVESATAEMRRAVKAVLCGDGADELFGGYLVHAAPGKWLDFVCARFSRAAALDRRADHTALDTFFGALSGAPPSELRSRIYQLYLDRQLSITHLERWDHLSMADSLEIRVPFLCNALATLSGELHWSSLLDESGGKRILKEVALRVLPEAVRERVVGRRKRPFWAATAGLYQELRSFVGSILPDDLRRAHPFRHTFDSAESQFFFDLFVLIFSGHRGRVPEGFAVRDLYADRWDLRELLRGL